MRIATPLPAEGAHAKHRSCMQHGVECDGAKTYTPGEAGQKTAATVCVCVLRCTQFRGSRWRARWTKTNRERRRGMNSENAKYVNDDDLMPHLVGSTNNNRINCSVKIISGKRMILFIQFGSSLFFVCMCLLLLLLLLLWRNLQWNYKVIQMGFFAYLFLLGGFFHIFGGMHIYRICGNRCKPDDAPGYERNDVIYCIVDVAILIGVDGQSADDLIQYYSI